MVSFYYLQIKLGKMTLEDVPEKFRGAVEKLLQEG